MQASCPTTLSAAIGLARLYEARLQSQRRTFTPDVKKTPMSSSLNVQRPTNPTIRRLIPAELKDRRDKGLCYNCDEKFGPGHRCKKLFLIEGSWSDDEEDDGKEVEEIEEKGEEENEAVGISLHALAGTQAPQTMRVRGHMEKNMITILVDSGSTHNFLSERVARRLRLQPKTDGRLQVTVASGERLTSFGKMLRGTSCSSRDHYHRGFLHLTPRRL